MNLDAHHQILLQHRTDDKMWDFPGGFMEPGETSEETAQREVREETWLEIGEMRLYMLQSWLHCATRSYHPIPSSNNDYLITSTE
jgi:8-oxo-dGTP pyrophosphatase MutT (NUDIX family)